MSIEEKAKAYDEALKWMRELYPGLQDATKEDAEHYFPELRESEDERIMKDIVAAVEMHGDLTQGRKSEIYAYLEKQKEHHIPWYDYQKSKEAGYTIVPNEEYEQLIKQKKQKSISQEDFDTAKHEALGEQNRDFTIYHPLKNGNGKYECIPYSFYGSLSAFSEDKALIDFLRTCFYTKEECEEWIKQKGQKPDIELIQRSWYMEGYHDREFGMEPRWIIRTGEGGPKHELNPRYGQPLTEQQVTEEQLHDLNEAIKGLRMDGCERIADSLHSLYNILTKEQKPVVTHGETYHVDTLGTQQVIAGKMPQKPAEWSDEDERMVRFYADDYDNNLGNMPMREVIENRIKFKDWLLNRLKSLRPQPHWKPSEEQMESLEIIVRYGNKESTNIKNLTSLYEQLKKL